MGTLMKVSDELRGHAKTSYLHQIGEPLMNKHIIDMINYVASANIRSSISTNCMLLDEEMTDRILNSKLEEIILCVDSLKEKTYQEIRKGGDLYTVLWNIRNFLAEKKHRKSNIYVQIQMIKMQENKDEWETLPKSFQDEAVNNIWMKEYSTFAGHIIKGESVSPRRFTCSKPFTHLTIQWNGDAVVCCRDYDGEAVMGNVNNQSIKDIWHSDRYNKFRKTFRESKFCKEC